MDEVSSHVCLVLPSTDGKAARKIVPPRLRIPYWKGLGADSEEKHEPASDIDTVVVDSLKALDPKRPIREADISAPYQEETSSSSTKRQVLKRTALIEPSWIRFSGSLPRNRLKLSICSTADMQRCGPGPAQSFRTRQL